MMTTAIASDLHARKTALRAEALARRAAMPFADVQAHSAAIADALWQLPPFRDAEIIAAYMAIGNEVQTAALLCAALAAGKRVALPRTVPAERRLRLHLVEDLSACRPGNLRILEPAHTSPEIAPADVSLFLVPGVVFDATGGRIGYGKGYYDALLAGCAGWRVALAYAWQVAPEVPTTDADIPVDLLATERGVLDCARSRQAGDHLRLRNMIFYGHHGAFPEERERGIRLAMDVDLRLDLQWPGRTDELAATVNYPAVYRLIQQVQSTRQFTLFETMVEQVATEILAQFPPVREVTVTARKFNPPVGGLLDAFEVEILRARPGWERPRRGL